MTMEIEDYSQWLDANSLNYPTPDFIAANSRSPSHSSPPAEQAERVERVERANQGTQHSSTDLPLLRLDDWEEDRQYDESNPVCIHYDFRWKISQRENIRARPICEDTTPSLVLAPSDYWKESFQSQLESLLQDRDNFPGDSYVCEKTSIAISIEKTRGRGLKRSFMGQDIRWEDIDQHIESLGGLFKLGRRITFSLEFIYKVVSNDSTTTKASNKKRNPSDEQRARLAAEAGLWTRVYKHHRCRAARCPKGPHCVRDQQGNHRKLNAKHLKAIYQDIRDNMKEGESVEEVDIDIDIPARILEDILQEPQPFSGDAAHNLHEYCTWVLAQVQSDRWRRELEVAIKFAMDQCLDLNSIVKHPQVIINAMVQGRVKLGSALQFTGNVDRFRKEGRNL